ncbi:MAG: tyrosine recombinase XerC [Clostridia bacterium]|nr:tyrosine recombinase XerC [Clostridia bacterium]
MDYLHDAPDVIRDYLVYMETIMGRSPKTVNEYYLDLRTFFRFILQKRKLVPADSPFDEISLDKVDIELARSVTRAEILDFLIYASRERPKYHKSLETSYGNSTKTRARKISALRGFYKYYCDKVSLIDNNPTNNLDIPKAQKALPKFLTLQESLNLLSSIDGHYKERDYCMITLFLNCGMRVSELAGINLSDISEDRIRIIGKGNKERIVYLNDACRAALEAYYPKRIPPKSGHTSALFISQQGKRIDVQTVKWIVKKNLEKCGLSQKKLSAHKLRHTAATLMYQNGVDVRTLKEVLGHENLDTTMIYTHIVDENLKDAASQNPLSAVKPPKKTSTDKDEESKV